MTAIRAVGRAIVASGPKPDRPWRKEPGAIRLADDDADLRDGCPETAETIFAPCRMIPPALDLNRSWKPGTSAR